MPHFSVHLREDTLDGTVEPRLIGALTDAVGAVFGADFRRLVGVDLIGIPAHRRGLGGAPAEHETPLVTLSLREAAFHLPQIPDAPARLVAAITDAVADTLGEPTRAHTVVTLTGTPEGRSGVAGSLA